MLVIKAPSDNKEQKRFLGYEWSNRKGDEGLKELNKPYLSPLFERDNPTNPNKLNFLVREAFNHTLESIPKELEPYAFRARLVDMLDFEKVEFNKAISLNPVQGNPSLRGGAEAIHANPFANSKYKLVRLGDIKGIAIKKGKSITKKETKEGVIKVVAGGINYAYLHNEANRPENTITISASGANAGFVNFWQEEIFASDCTTINLDSDISIRFVFYILQSIQKNIYGLARGAAQPHVYPKDIENIKIPFPDDLEIQKQIVEECQKVEKQSSTIKTSIEKYQELIKAILAKCAITESSADNASIQEILTQLNTLESSLDFDLLFECLESTNADSQKDISGVALNIAGFSHSEGGQRMTEESKNLDSNNTESKVESTPLKPLNLKALLDSLPTPPPQGWERVRLGEVCEILIGGTPPRNNQSYFNGNHLWVSIAEMQGKIITNTKEKISDEGIKKSNVKLIPKGSVLLSFKLSIGKTAIAGKDLYTNEAIAGLIPKNKENIKDNYLFFIFKYKSINLNLKDNNAFGKSLNSDILKNDVQIPLPPLESQDQIINAISKIEEKISLMDSSLESLEGKKSKILKSALEST